MQEREFSVDARFIGAGLKPLVARLVIKPVMRGAPTRRVLLEIESPMPRGWWRPLAAMGMKVGSHNASEVAAEIHRLAMDAPPVWMSDAPGLSFGSNGVELFLPEVVVTKGAQGHQWAGDDTLDPDTPYTRTLAIETKPARMGSLQGWIDAMNNVSPKDSTRAWAALYAAVLPVFSRIPFVFSLSAPAGSGLDAVLAMAASVWQQPGGWDVPRPGDYLPKVGFPPVARDMEGDLLKMLPDGPVIAKLPVSPSSEPIADELRRVTVDLIGSPMGKTSPGESETLLQKFEENWAHFGPELVARWQRLDEEAQGRALRAIHIAANAGREKGARLGGPAGALGEIVGTIVGVGRVVHAMFKELRDDAAAEVEPMLLNWLVFNLGTESKLARAAEMVFGYAASNQDRIEGIRHPRHSPPTKGWIGTYDTRSGLLWLSATKVKELLRANGFNPMECINGWAGDGDLVVLYGKPIQTKKINKLPTTCIAFTPDAWKQARSGVKAKKERK